MGAKSRDVSRQLFRLGAELRRRATAELAEECEAVRGLRPLATAVLMIVNQRGPSSQREISGAVGLNPSDLVTILDQLEAVGLLERRRDPEDRRRNVVVVTSEGTRTAKRLTQLAERAEEAVLARLSPPERAELARLLTRALGDD